jgi:hypothetical protein
LPRVWWNRSTLPVVVGARTLGRRWPMPLSGKLCSTTTSAGRGLPNRPVNGLPLSVKTSSGMP